MKNKQRTVSKFIHLFVIILFLPSGMLCAQSYHSTLERADSLFIQKRYTQSLELYKGLFNKKIYSPSMLLKMAFIQDGLGNIAQLMRYLSLYILISGDDRAFLKIEKMAKQYQLQGYEWDGLTRVRYVLYRSYTMLSVVGVLVLLLCGLLMYRQRKAQRRSYWLGSSFLFLLILFFLHINFSNKIGKGIIAARLTYLMDGPSAGASVVDVLGAGHQISVLGSRDVWFHVQWMDQGVYIKKNQMLLIEQ